MYFVNSKEVIINCFCLLYCIIFFIFFYNLYGLNKPNICMMNFLINVGDLNRINIQLILKKKIL